MINWLERFNAKLLEIEGYLRAVREQKITFSMDEYNRLCDELKAIWAQRPQPPIP